MKYSLYSVFTSLLFIFLLSCSEENATKNNDNKDENDDGTKETVVIGTQTWTKKNLNVLCYRNGDTIPEVKGLEKWKSLTTGAWCYYNNDPENGKIYGKLYNWYAVNDPRGLAPVGFHIPTDADWDTLIVYLGGESEASGKLKEADTVHWKNANIVATNQSQFTALPGGCHDPYIQNGFTKIGTNGFWWTSTFEDETNVWYRGLVNNTSSISHYYTKKNVGYSVRCVKD